MLIYKVARLRFLIVSFAFLQRASGLKYVQTILKTPLKLKVRKPDPNSKNTRSHVSENVLCRGRLQIIEYLHYVIWYTADNY